MHPGQRAVWFGFGLWVGSSAGDGEGDGDRDGDRDGLGEATAVAGPPCPARPFLVGLGDGDGDGNGLGLFDRTGCTSTAAALGDRTGWIDAGLGGGAAEVTAPRFGGGGAGFLAVA